MDESPAIQPNSTAGRPRRRRFALSLRGLMVLVLVVGGVLGWKARRASIQRRAVAQIKAAGGGVAYDYQMLPYGQIQFGASPKTPRWVREGLGDELFQEVSVVSLGDIRGWFKSPRTKPPKVPPEALDALPDLDQLRRLILCGVPLEDPRLGRLAMLTSLEDLELFLFGLESSHLDDLPSLRSLRRLKSFRICPSPEDDAGLEFLRGLDGLTSVSLGETRVTDASLSVLTTLPKLYSVEFDGSKITDSGLADLAKIRSLKTLHLLTNDRAALYTDQGLAHLSRIPYLSDLALDVKNITDAGFEALQALQLYNLTLTGLAPGHERLVQLAGRQSLQMLCLSGIGITDDLLGYLTNWSGRLNRLELSHTQVTDAGMVHIIKHPGLRYLVLDATMLTDAGLLRLAAAPALQCISARGTKVTPAGVAAFRAVRPAVVIEIGPLPPR